MEKNFVVDITENLGDIIEKIAEKKLKMIENCEDFEKQIKMMKNFLSDIDEIGWDYGYTISHNPVLKGLDFYINPDLYEDEVEDGMYIDYMEDIGKHAFYENHQFQCFLEAEL